MKTGSYSVQVRPKGRTAADEYLHKGRTYIEGRHNSSYVIELTNHSSSRVEAVVSVDGLAVSDGQPASFSSRGFVLNPHQTQTVEGWLLNSEQAAAFVFGHKNTSYSTQMGSGGNEGVIGVAWFAEAYLQTRRVPVATSSWATTITDSVNPLSVSNLSMGCSYSSISSSSLAQNSLQGNMGTGFGPAVDFATNTTAFARAGNEPTAVSLIYYDSAASLQKMGIVLRTRISKDVAQAFPGNSSGYCEPPPNWSSKRW